MLAVRYDSTVFPFLVVASVNYVPVIKVDSVVVSPGMVSDISTSCVQFNVPRVFLFPCFETCILAYNTISTIELIL